MSGYVKLFRNLKEWRWYTDIPTKTLFIHLLLSANYKEGFFLKHEIKRGEVVTGRKELSVETGLTEQNVRTALNKLKSTSEITIINHNKFSIITICNYEQYQGEKEKINQRPNQRLHHNIRNKNKEIKKREYSAQEFEEFWKEYPNKKDKKKAEEAFSKTEAPLEEILLGLKKYKAGKEDWRQWKMAATWLNGECWNDEYSTPGKEGMSWRERNELTKKSAGLQ